MFSKTVNCSRPGSSLLLLAVLALVSGTAAAQSYRTGQHVEPAYEGWRQNEDGTYSFMFGYMNENWEESPDVPVGENNYFSPGDADRGQPTHFLPRRNRFNFEVTVPADWGDRELVWTLNVNGVERKAYATLRQDYLVDNMVIASETGSLGAGTSSPESRANTKPDVCVQGDSFRVVGVGEPVALSTLIRDDGIPEADREPTTTSDALMRRMMRPPSRVTVGKINGLFLSWNKDRGPVGGKVTFDPPMPKPWEDTRTSANSPWGAMWHPPEQPEDGLWNTTATFSMPGRYILWARADDGGLYNDAYVTIEVTE